eukprot:7449810-Alexandrium_andersonii.AAC.1
MLPATLNRPKLGAPKASPHTEELSKHMIASACARLAARFLAGFLHREVSAHGRYPYDLHVHIATNNC